MSSKAIPLLVAGTGGTATAVGGTYLLQRSGGSTSEGASSTKVTGSASKPSSTTALDNDLSTFKDVTTFENGKEGSCVQYVFGKDLDLKAKGNKTDGVDFTSNTSEDVKSCLVVNWEKTNYSEVNSSKWKGYFRWVWSFSAGNKGFVIFLTTKENSLELDTGFYYMEKGSESPYKWSVKKYKTPSGTKSIDKSGFTSNFTVADSTIMDSLTKPDNKDNWGFVTGEDDMNNFCNGDGGCGNLNTNSKKLFQESWLWKKEGTPSAKITGWMKNYDTWFKGIFTGETFTLDGFTGSWSRFDQSTERT